MVMAVEMIKVYNEREQQCEALQYGSSSSSSSRNSISYGMAVEMIKVYGMDVSFMVEMSLTYG